MAALVLTVAQQKGGAGKTTLVAQLASALSADRKVAVLDIDPQRSLTLWYELRRARLGAAAASMTFADISGWKLTAEIERLRRTHDVVLIDSAPHAETDARLAVRASDLVLVPVQPSPLDVWATAPTLALAKAEKREARVMFNRAPARGKLLDQAVVDLGKSKVAMLDARLGNRSAYAMAMAAGLGVVEAAPKGLAAAEVRGLVAALEPWLAKGRR